MPKFSIVISTFNRAHYLNEALHSVFSQTCKDFEVIVVDDGSVDDTKRVISNFEGKLRYIYQENQGRSGARNTGIKAAQGEYIAFLDSDDRWFPDKLERQVQALTRHPKTAFLHGHVEVIDKNGNFLEDESRRMQALWSKSYRKGHSYENWAIQCCCLLSTVVMRTECVREVGEFDPQFKANEDLDYYLRFATRYKIRFLDSKPLTYYRMHDNNSGNHNLAIGAIGVAKKHLALLESNTLRVDRHSAHVNFQLSLSKSFFLLRDKTKGREHFLKAMSRSPMAITHTPVLRLFIASFLPRSFLGALNYYRQSRMPSSTWSNKSSRHVTHRH